MEGLRDHGFYQAIAYRTRGARTRLIQQTLHAPRRKARTPFAHGLGTDPQQLRHFAIRAIAIAREHDTGSQFQRMRDPASARPPMELRALLGRQGYGLGSRTTLHHAAIAIIAVEHIETFDESGRNALCWERYHTVALPFQLQRSQEVDQVLLILRIQGSKVLDDLIRLASLAGVILNRLKQIARSAVVREEYALPQTPQRCGTELVRPRLAPYCRRMPCGFLALNRMFSVYSYSMIPCFCTTDE